jgi:hypothetical protein
VKLRKVTLGQRSSAAPALASWQGSLYVAWTGRDTHLNVMSSSDARNFANHVRLDHKSYKTESSMSSSSGFSDTETVALAPSLAASEHGVDLAWSGSDGHVNILRAAGSPPHLRLAERTVAAPTLAALGPDLALAWTGTDRHLNVVVSQHGTFGAPIRLDEKSWHSPALCAMGTSELALAWTGTDRHLNVVVSHQAAFGRPLRLDGTSFHGPALLAAGTELALGWTGSDRRINLMLSRSGGFDAPLVLDEKSVYAPAIGIHLNEFFLAWTGSDGRLNLAAVDWRP